MNISGIIFWFLIEIDVVYVSSDKEFYNIRVYILLFSIIYEIYSVGSQMSMFKDQNLKSVLTFYLSDTKSVKNEIVTNWLPN